jgi:hypothetical protein
MVLVIAPKGATKSISDVSVERHTANATLFKQSDGKLFWLPKSVYDYDAQSGVVSVPADFEIKEAAPYNGPTTSSGNQHLKRNPAQVCPHCLAPLHILPAWEKKERPADGIKGACKTCGGFFMAVPHTTFTINKYYLPDTDVDSAENEDKPDMRED